MNPNRQKQRNVSGFSLIEVIASLMLLGIIGSIWGLGIVQVVDAFILSKDSRESIQKAQSGMNRLIKEFHEMNKISAIPAPPSEEITYTRKNAGTDTDYTITYDPVAKKLKINGSILADNISEFSLNYYDKHDAASPLSDPVVLATVRIIDIRLKIRNAGNTFSTYENRVFLRGLN